MLGAISLAQCHLAEPRFHTRFHSVFHQKQLQVLLPGASSGASPSLFSVAPNRANPYRPLGTIPVSWSYHPHSSLLPGEPQERTLGGLPPLELRVVPGTSPSPSWPSPTSTCWQICISLAIWFSSSLLRLTRLVRFVSRVCCRSRKGRERKNTEISKAGVSPVPCQELRPSATQHYLKEGYWNNFGQGLWGSSAAPAPARGL